MIGRQHQQQRVAVFVLRIGARDQRGDRDRRRGIAADRFEHDPRLRSADHAQLLGDEEAMVFVGDDQRRGLGQRRDAAPRGLQHGVIADQRQELLGVGLARQRPQPGSGPARQQHRLQFDSCRSPENEDRSLPCRLRTTADPRMTDAQNPAASATAAPETGSDARSDARLRWAREAAGEPGLTLERASMDAGFRSYWRGASASGRSLIVMDSPPDKEDVRPWLQVRALLEGGGVRVPRVLAEDTDAGFLLLEDLGYRTYLHVFETDTSAAETMFEAAFDQLLKLQAIAVPADFPDYDDALLTRELRLFDEWFLSRHLDIALDCGDLEALDLTYRRLIDAALAQPQVLVHRDFMPRNLMPLTTGDGPAVLDFQDAVRGPIAYDALSLFKDAFWSWPPERVEAWLDRYHARALDAGLPVPSLERFRRDADWIGVQRHLKVMGIFARLNYRDGKPKYLADAPRFLAYLDGVLPRYPELAPLADLIDRHVRPRLAAQA